jgi:hypothetical protein
VVCEIGSWAVGQLSIAAAPPILVMPARSRVAVTETTIPAAVVA